MNLKVLNDTTGMKLITKNLANKGHEYRDRLKIRARMGILALERARSIASKELYSIQ